VGIFSGMMYQQITLKPFSAEATSGWRGAAAFGSSVTYTCRVEMKTRHVVASDGHDKLSTGRVILEGDITVGVRDELTLPTGMTPQKPPILDIAKNPGIFGGPGETVIYF
jgi:hypothetical protein